MSLLVKNIFEAECKDLLIDSNLAKRIVRYQLLWAAKNDEHVKFFGGHLTGVQVVRFTDSDRQVWFEEILRANNDTLQEKLFALEAVHEHHIVASDAMNLSCTWLVHMLMNAKGIPEKLRHDAIISTLLVLQYKFLTSRLFRHFRFPAVPATAEAAYASLSMKFDLKQAGSWGVLLNQRAESIVEHSAIHYQTLMTMNDDTAVEKFLNDVQTRLRSMLIKIVNVHYTVSAQGKKISTTSATLEHDGKEILKDRTRSLANYTRYIHSIIPDKESFLREELLVVIEKIIHTMPPHLFRDSLGWMSEQYQGPRSTDLHDLVQEIMIHSFDYLAHNHSAVQNSHDLAGMLVRLKGVYTAARSTDPVLYALRDRVEQLVKDATSTRNVSLLAPTRTGVLLYITLRALSKRHYADS